MNTSTLPKLNLLLLEEIVLWCIEQAKLQAQGKPNSWDQGSWYYEGYGKAEECGAACCLYGRAAIISPQVEIVEVKCCGENSRCEERDFHPRAQIERNGELVDATSWRAIGDYLLGVTDSEGYRLSNGDNNVYDVIKVAQRIVRSRGEDSPLLRIDTVALYRELCELKRTA